MPVAEGEDDIDNVVIVSNIVGIKWALSRENLSSGCPTKRVSNQFPQLQRLARKMKFCMEQACLLCSPDSE